MKFTDGYWQMRPGNQAFYAVQAFEIESSPDALTVHAATKKILTRADMLDGPMLSLRFSSPMENVLRVQMLHHKGVNPPRPEFILNDSSHPQVVIESDAHSASLTSGQLSVHVQRGGGWRVEYTAGGRPLTSSGESAMGIVDTPAGRFIHAQLDLDVGECVYGLGERFSAFVKNGQVVDLWNEDGGTSSEQTYKNIPFYLTNRGYGVFVAHPEKVSFELASEKVERVQFSLPGESLEYYFIYGPTPKDVLERYTALTGRPALPPAWSFGLWLSTSFTTDYDEKTVTGFVQEMRQRGMPLHVFHFDCFWMKAFSWCDFQWDRRVFPDPPGMLRRLKEMGLHVCVWINPYISQHSSLFDEAAAAGYLLKRPNGDVWQWDRWQPGMGIVDFTNPSACSWFQEKLRALLEMGVDAFKTDFGERIPTDVTWFDGSDPFKMHNYYSYLYNRTVFELLREVRGAGEAVVFARAATAGGQQFPVHWGGDSTATFESMAETLRGGLSLGLSGFGFWSHDIGGFEHTASAAVYKRWCAFGLLSSHSRLHGNNSYRVPWAYDDEAVEVLAKFTRLKCSLMPYLYGAACEAHRRGLPMLRAMLLEFPDDPACDYLDRQYMLGESLLVAPIFSQEGVVDYYVPAGRWTNILNGSVLAGPRWLRETHDFGSLPLLARPNSIIPVGSRTDRPDYDFADGVTLHVYEMSEGERTVNIPSLTGEVGRTFHLRRSGSLLEVQPGGPAKPWQILLAGIGPLQSVQDGRAEISASGAQVIPGDYGSQLVIRLSEAS
jgi:alpha-D-xyloside xylohydrolase